MRETLITRETVTEKSSQREENKECIGLFCIFTLAIYNSTSPSCGTGLGLGHHEQAITVQQIGQLPEINISASAGP